MIENDSLKVIAEDLQAAKSVQIFPHIVMDGDAIGSAAALCLALTDMGKEAVIVTEDKTPDNLAFLEYGLLVSVEEASALSVPDLCVCVDCGEVTRFPKREALFWRGKKTLCIDHHATSPGIADKNYIEPDSAATGEIIYLLLKEMGAEITMPIAAAIYAAITTDTGNFQYANTTVRSHEIVADLLRLGLDPYPVSVELYESSKPAQFKLYAKILDRMEFFAGGEGVISRVTQEMLKECGALMEDSEGVVGDLRSIKGVQIAVMLKEQEDGAVKVSFRAKEKGNVARVAAAYEGGGHEKAAGCTLTGYSLEQAAEEMKKAVEDELGR